jgi:hypothetical protein
LTQANTLAYFSTELITSVKKFYSQARGVNLRNLVS